MRREHHRWYSERIGRELGVMVYGHWGPPMILFPTSGGDDMKRFMNGAYDDNFYFNNPVDYLANLGDPWMLGQLASCDIHLATGTGPFEHSSEAYRLSEILASRGVPHHLDDWGPLGGH